MQPVERLVVMSRSRVIAPRTEEYRSASQAAGGSDIPLDYESARSIREDYSPAC